MLQKFLALFRMNILILLLLIGTVMTVLIYYNGMDKIYNVSLADYPYVISTSDSVDGGRSVTQMQRTDSSIILDYELKEGSPYPYAGIKIYLGDGKSKGIDFSTYDSIFLWVKPRGEGSVRLYLRGFDSTISKIEDPVSLKFNELEYFPLDESYPAVFVPEEFRVAGWWVAQHNVNVHRARVELSNITFIEIQTGTSAPLGYGTLEIRGISFKGKIISEVKIASILVAIWFVTFLIILIIRFLEYSREHALNKRKREELEKNLQALEIEKNDFEKLSKEDPLTGCLNRAGFSSVLTREQERRNKQGLPVSFVILDIDNFKEINDTYGHTVGDEVLVNLSKLVQSKIRNTDVLVRWGGEEFVILCGNTPLQNAQVLAEKLRESIEKTKLIAERRITCSFGVAEMLPFEDAKELFNRADKALYASKSAGRNRVTSASLKRTSR
jgi:diguanylate cyclase (GGDEF)-like protein